MEALSLLRGTDSGRGHLLQVLSFMVGHARKAIGKPMILRTFCAEKQDLWRRGERNLPDGDIGSPPRNRPERTWKGAP